MKPLDLSALKGDDSPVTEPDLPAIDGKLLRVFPEELPADELNTKIDEWFVPAATNALPQTAAQFQSWRATKLAELRRIAFRSVPEKFTPRTQSKFNRRKAQTGALATEPGITSRSGGNAFRRGTPGPNPPSGSRCSAMTSRSSPNRHGLRKSLGTAPSC